jgi:hypothetical protein
MISTTLGFSENSKRAVQTGACYGKLRRAELRRSIWTFATRRTALRALDSNTLLLGPSLWSSTTNYFVGSLVTDASGTYWQSILPNNLNNQPGQIFNAWVTYFGPLSVSLYDSSQNYFSGEVVYTAAGDGSYNVFSSLANGNALHPALPNQWGTNTTYFRDNVVQEFPAWASGTTYSAGQGALYADGNVYVSLVGSNTNHLPPSSGTYWSMMPTLTLTTQQVPSGSFTSPQNVSPTPIGEWNIEGGYSLGSFVIFNALPYVSLKNVNTGQFPNVASSTYWATVTNGTLWQSLIDLNIGNDPKNTPAVWSLITTYTVGQVVAATDGFNYTATALGGNLNQNPALGVSPTYWTQGGYTAWTSTFTAGGGNSQWMQIGGAAFPSGVALFGLNITYPVGCGPVSDASTKNVFRLPANYLRKAPQDPKAGVYSWLGAPGNRQADDWTFEGGYLITLDGGPMVFRFIADVQNVAEFDDTFCEMLAYSIAKEVCEPLTQSREKLSGIEVDYQMKKGEALLIGGIEEGIEEPPLDDFVACRI